MEQINQQLQQHTEQIERLTNTINQLLEHVILIEDNEQKEFIKELLKEVNENVHETKVRSENNTHQLNATIDQTNNHEERIEDLEEKITSKTKEASPPTIPAATAASIPRSPPVFGTTTLFTFLMIFPLTSTKT